MTKIANFKNGHATLEKLFPSGMYLVRCVKGTEIYDKIRTDDYRQAQEYFRAFKAISKAA